MEPETLQQAFNRILSENSNYNRRIKLILDQLDSNPVSKGLSEQIAVRKLNEHISTLEASVRGLEARVEELEGKLARSKELVIRELVEALK